MIKKFIIRLYILCLAILIFPNNNYGQKLLADTIYVDFKGDTMLSLGHACIKSIQDNRNEDPHFIMYQTKNKILIFPVDQEFHTKQPLADAVFKGLEPNEDCRTTYTLVINKFEIEKRKGRFSTTTFLVADIPVFENRNDTQYYRGTFYHDYQYQPLNRREPAVESAENLLHAWHTAFKIDMIKLNAIKLGASAGLAPNFLTNPAVRPMYLNVQTGAFAGLDWYGFQGEIYFSRPEIHANNKYVSGIFRYQNTRNFESFAIGKNAEHLNYRANENFLFGVDLNILLGFLKWKDVRAHEPTLYQIFNAEISSIQSIHYNKKNMQGLTFRLGAIETLGYIIDKKLEFRFGLFAGFGYKF